MGEVIKKNEKNSELFTDITGVGEYTQEELANFDINNFVNFLLLNKEFREIIIPENKDRIRLTLAIHLNYTEGNKKQKYVSVDKAMKKLDDKLGV